ncbi:N-alpha-acetyltransferase 15, NatA auxiliary subunit [Hondaea fermentalgiana]|uniref:N-alpha-acetyltransferase 15, NatA auxiliary subunit n=1 Tax=Hondaea fermentalgiana TaxID=2315210 RepID=A0A2R5GUH1_9STRA|nr:N-alpha-acetyltransferase 15, NatA auxiliary subunit [Hondaea fermentalgiana]|eukprot:GBG34502.1 N-alpha-acetyltransferase 15, NatA auxiliary subunit [Hondaea fermentalgiana]
MNKIKVITKKRLNTVIAEASILRKVDYPFVARVHQVFQDEVSIYFLLDILPGGELKFHLRRMPVVPHEVAQFWMACLVLGIGYLHSRHIIHRDLKPSNCLLDGSGYVVISDFGLSVTADSAEALRHDQCCGTPGYIAPEMYLGPCWDRRRPTEVKKKSSVTRKSTWLTTFQSSMRAFTSKSARIDAFDPSNAQLARGAANSSRADTAGTRRHFTDPGTVEEKQRMPLTVNTQKADTGALTQQEQQQQQQQQQLASPPYDPASPVNPLLTSPGSPSPASPGVVGSPLSPNVAIGSANGQYGAAGASFRGTAAELMQPLFNDSGKGGGVQAGQTGQPAIAPSFNTEAPRRLSDPDRLPRYPNYGVSVDWFALGVILHQFYCLGRMPFTRGPKRSHRTLLKNMVMGKVRWSESALQCAERNRNELHRRTKEPGRAEKPIVGLTYEAQDLVHKLLHHDPGSRLGCGPRGVREIMEHPFFDGIDWDKLEKRHIVPPFVPSATSVNAEFQPNDYDPGEPTKKEKRKSSMLTDEHHRASFKDLEYVRPETLFEELIGCQIDFEINQNDQERMEDGELAPGVELYIATRDLSTEVKAGRTIMCTEKGQDGIPTRGKVAYVDALVDFVPARDATYKPRSEWTTEDIAEYIVIPRTKDWQKTPFYFNLPEFSDGDAGKEFAGYFVSQARKCRFRDLVKALENRLRNEPDDKKYVWLDIISANQPVLTAAASDVPSEIGRIKKWMIIYGLHVALKSFEKLLLFFDSWETPAPLQRTWCVWEIYGAAMYKRDFEVILAPGQEMSFARVLHNNPEILSRLAVGLDMRRSETSQMSDKKLIDEVIDERIKGGFTTLNVKVSEHVRHWIAQIALAHIKWSREELPKQRNARDSSVHLTTTLSRAADLFHQLGDYAQAEALASEALQRMQASSDHDELAQAIQRSNVASVQDELEKLAAARTNYEAALVTFRTFEDRKLVAETLVHLGYVRQRQQDNSETVSKLYREALEIYENELGAQDKAAVGQLKVKMADVHAAEEQFEAAKEVLLDAKQYLEQVYPPRSQHNVPLLAGLAEAHRGLGELSDASREMKKALEICSEVYGPLHPETAMCGISPLRECAKVSGRPKMGKKKAAGKKAPAAAPAASPAAKQDTQTLPKKEESLFKELVRLHENKQYKKALKTADTILKKCPEHGETNAMKGLTFNSMGEKDKAFELAKLGVRYNLKSAVCWHVYGIIYRSEKNYKEAIKCFQRAVRFNPSHLQIVRELSVLQIQVRDIPGFTSSRMDLVRQQGGLRSNWLGYSLAHHLAGNHKMAITILDQYLSTLATDREPSYEESEILLYKLQILEEMGDKESMMQLLDRNFYEILDRNTWLEKKVQLYLALGRREEARQYLSILLKRNPENHLYHRDLQNGHPRRATLSDEQISKLSGEYDELFASMKRKPSSLGRIPMGYLRGDGFRKHTDTFLRASLRKGIPSVFSSLRPIYKQALRGSPAVSEQVRKNAAERVQIIGELVEGYVESLDSVESLPESSDKEAPTTKLWALFFLAQHYDMLGEQRAIEHTPTTLDLFVAKILFYTFRAADLMSSVKGRILKHAGDMQGAADAVEAGRELDLADKWINSKATKYHLRAGRIAKAEDVVGLFTKHEGDSRGYLKEMQAMWFEKEIARSFSRAKDLQMALKFYAAIVEHFDDFEEDQLEFHLYCLRKATMRAYLSTLRLEDTIRGHPSFSEAAHGQLSCLLALHDRPQDYQAIVEEAKKNAPTGTDAAGDGSNGGTEASKSSEPDYSGMSAAEKKKAKAKARKEEARRKKEQEENSANADKDEADETGKSKKRSVAADKDPKGAKLLADQAAAPLDTAHALCEVLRKFAPHRSLAQLDIFDVEVRRGKMLQALRALSAAAETALDGAQNPLVFARLAPFLHFVQAGKITYAPWVSKSTCAADVNTPVDVALELDPAVKTCIESLASKLMQEPAGAAAKTYFEKHSASESLAARLAAAKALIRVEAQTGDAATKTLRAIVSKLPEKARFKDLADMHEALRALAAPDALLSELEEAIKVKFPRSSLAIPSPDFGVETDKGEAGDKAADVEA